MRATDQSTQKSLTIIDWTKPCVLGCTGRQAYKSNKKNTSKKVFKIDFFLNFVKKFIFSYNMHRANIRGFKQEILWPHL